MINDSLLFKYLAGEASTNEASEIQNWIKKEKANEEHFDNLSMHYNNDVDDADLENDWDQLETKINSLHTESRPQQRSIRPWFIRIAAVLILAIGTTLIFNIQKNEIVVRGTSDEAIASVLPDGSEVFLSKGSRLVYTKDFNGESREVNIFGDAFFTVASDPDRPFIVHSGEAKIRVTGTSFHVSAPIRNNDIEVTVRSGKVLFYNSETYSENSFKVDLGPGDKGTYSPKLNQLNKTHDSEYKQLSWNYN